MSDDLVKRLRERCSCNIDTTPCLAEEECRDAFEAADRIEELEKQVLTLLAQLGQEADENERMRKALTNISKSETYDRTHGEFVPSDEAMEARVALKETDK